MALRGQGDPSRERALGLLMQMSGNKALGGAGEGFVGDAQRQAQLAQQAPLVQAETATKQYGITRQPSLGGQTPTAYELLTKRQRFPSTSQPSRAARYSTNVLGKWRQVPEAVPHRTSSSRQRMGL